MREKHFSMDAMIRFTLVVVFTLLITITVTMVFFIGQSNKNYAESIEAQIRSKVSGLDENLGHMNLYMTSILYNSGNLMQLTQSEEAIDRIDYARKLLGDIEAATTFLPSGFHFLIQVKSSGQILATESAEIGYKTNQQVKAYIVRTLFAPGYKKPAKASQWIVFEVDGKPYLGQFYETEDCRMAVYVFAENAFAFFDDIFVSGSGGYAIGAARETVSDYWNGRMVATLEAKHLSECISYAYDYSGVKTETMVFVVAIAAIILVILVFSISTTTIYQRRVLEPLRMLAAEELDIDGIRSMMEKTRFKEVRQTTNAVLNLYEQIRQLKIRQYEDTIDKQKTELEFLQIQIRPHFYINCLSILFAMAQNQQYARIQKMCVKLSSYMRYLFSREIGLVSIAEELQHIDEYLFIQDIRFHSRTELLNRMEGEIEQVPALSLLSIVENAVKHNQGYTKELKITISCEKREKQAVFSVADNGQGFDDAILESLNDQSYFEQREKHIGIRNTWRRLKLIYGESASMRFANQEEGGAVVTITIPLCPPP